MTTEAEDLFRARMDHGAKLLKSIVAALTKNDPVNGSAATFWFNNVSAAMQSLNAKIEAHKCIESELEQSVRMLLKVVDMHETGTDVATVDELKWIEHVCEYSRELIGPDLPGEYEDAVQGEEIEVNMNGTTH